MKFVIANWKMNLSVEQSISLAKEYLKVFKETPAEIVVCPSFTSLPFVGKILGESELALGAQDMFWEESGAYTGQISPTDLADLGTTYVIIGHSERRELGEEDWMINRKIQAALEHKPLCPILCIGETAEDKDTDERETVLTRQLTEALHGIRLGVGQNLIVAYEPVWAIGSGETPEADDVAYITDMIKVLLRRLLGSRADDMCAVIYGGSVDEESAEAIANLGSVDGFLVGGASLNAREFYRIAQTVLD